MSVSVAQSTQSVLLAVADYLGKPQRFLTVADARAELKRTLELASQSSVVLTTNGAPSAAIVSFETLEAMRSALMQILVREIEQSFQLTLAQVASEPGGEPTSEAELEALVRESVRKARRKTAKPKSARIRRR
jgi:PHD/YefM family antitoxin component YafN of YafNO toxin-antitoxin module